MVPVTNSHTEKVEPPFLWDGLPHLDSMEGFFFLLAEDGRVLFIQTAKTPCDARRSYASC